MEDLKIKCLICGFESLDLHYHIERCHGISSEQYKEETGGDIVSSSVLSKRQNTSMERHNEKHFTNREAAKLSFQRYEKGHPLSDPSVREKACETKERLYGDRNYTNREQAKKTSLEHYGVEYTCAAPKVIEKRIATLKARYGRVFNVVEPHNKFHLKDVEEFKSLYLSGMSLWEMTQKYATSEPTLNKIIKELGLSRSIRKPSVRDIETPSEAASGYLSACLGNNKVLSFYEYGKIRGQQYNTKMKRLFNAGKPYNFLLEELRLVALSPDKHSEFLSKLK